MQLYLTRRSSHLEMSDISRLLGSLKISAKQALVSEYEVEYNEKALAKKNQFVLLLWQQFFSDRELLTIKVEAADIDVLVSELLLTRPQADRLLREHNGDLDLSLMSVISS